LDAALENIAEALDAVRVPLKRKISASRLLIFIAPRHLVQLCARPHKQGIDGSR
jgi:hypothetical protein